MKKEIMVKVCSKCGIVNTEKAEDCESCGSELGAPVTNREANKLSKQIVKRNEKIRKAIAAEKFSVPEEEPVDIPVTPAHIVVGVIGCIAAVCEVVLMVLCDRLFPEDAGQLFLAGFSVLVLFAIAVLYCFMPGRMWTIGHCMDRIYYKEMPRPSDTGIKLQIVSSVILVLIGVAFITLQILIICGVL